MKPQHNCSTTPLRPLKTNKHLLLLAGVAFIAIILLLLHADPYWMFLLPVCVLPVYLVKLPRHKHPEPPACITSTRRTKRIPPKPNNKQPRFIRHAHNRKQRH